MSSNYVDFCSSIFNNDTDPVIYANGKLMVIWCNTAAAQYKKGESLRECFNPPLTLPLDDKLYLGSYSGAAAELRVSVVNDGGETGYLVRFSLGQTISGLLSKSYITEYTEAVISRINTSVHAMSAVCEDISKTYEKHGIRDKKTGLNIIDGNCKLLTKKAQEMNSFLSLLTCRHEYDRPVNLADILYNEELILKNILKAKRVKLTFKIEDDLFVSTAPRTLAALIYNITEMLFSRRMLMDDVTITATDIGESRIEVIFDGKNVSGSFLEGSPLYAVCEVSDRNLLNNLTYIFVKEYCSRYGADFEIAENCDYSVKYRLILPATDRREIVLNSSSLLRSLTEAYDPSFHPLLIRLNEIMDLSTYE